MSINHQMNDYGYNEGIVFYGIVPKVMEATSIKTIGENELEVIDFQETAWGNAVDPEPEPEPDTHEYVDLGLPSKTLWATENIKDADGNELYFAWGEISGYTSGQVGTDKNFNWNDYEFGASDNLSKYNNSDGKTELESTDDAATENWGSNWKMPTKEQFEELTANTEYEWTEIDGVQGGKFTSTVSGYTDKFLFFPAVGSAGVGEVVDVGDYGYYWSVSLEGGYVGNAWYFYFDGGSRGLYNDGRCYGYSVRPVRFQNL
jgi:hypothetical protein